MFKVSNIYFFKELLSTNTYLADNFNKYDNLSIVCSDTQTSGRGRNNRVWISSYIENLYFSILLKDLSYFKILTQLPILSSISIYRTINTYYNKIKIKWPNDIVIVKDNAFYKIAGILIDSFKDYMVLGFGVNLNIAPSINDQNTCSLKDLINKDIDKKIFLNNFIFNFEDIFNEYIKFGFNKFQKEYNNNAYKLNDFIEIKDNLNIYSGKYLGIDNNGFALLSNNKDLLRLVNGEVKNNL